MEIELVDKYEMKIIKTNKLLIFLIIIFLITFTIWSGYEFLIIKVNAQGRINLVFSKIFIEIIIIYYILITFHELGHLFMIKFFKYNIKLFVVGPFIIIRENAICKFRIKFTNLSMSGMVLVDIDEIITSEEEYKAFIYKCKVILLGGMLFNLVLIMLSSILMQFKSTIDIGFLMISLNVGVIISCLLPFNDISRVIQLNKEPKEIIIFFLENLIIDYQTNDLIKEKINNYIDSMLLKKQYNLSVLNSIIAIIKCNFIQDKKNSLEINKFLNWFSCNYNNCMNTKNIVMKLTMSKLVDKMILYNIISKDIIIVKRKYKVKEHPLHNIYIQFDSYKKGYISKE